MKRNQTNRRGVVLLVILGMLALFMLIVVSYVMTASAEKRGAAIAAVADQAGDPPDALMQNAVLQVVRGPRNPNSVIGPHSLLEDMYGDRDSIVGALPPPPPTGPFLATNSAVARFSDRQIIELTGLLSFGPDRQPGLSGVDDNNDGVFDDIGEFSPSASGGGDRFLGAIEPLPLQATPGSVPPVDNVEGYYAGRVMTMLDGPAAKHSTRIIRWWQNGNAWTMWIRPFANGALPESSNRFIINGRPFNGTGFGFNATGSSSPNYIANDKKDSNGFEFALLPNPTDPQYRLFMDQNFNPDGVDADEDYDIANWDNMALACRMYNEATGRWQVRIPSFHRPELLHYWKKRLGLSPSASWTEIPVAIRRRINLRPDPEDHVYLDLNGNGRWDSAETWSDFNGNGVAEGDGTGPLGPGKEWLDNVVNNGRYDYAEPNYASASKTFHGVNGPWDVDNDGDGEPDSVWIDFGFPVQTAQDGRQFKALAAVLCLDLDGRINLNAHGNPTHYKYADSTGGANTSSIDWVNPWNTTFSVPPTVTQNRVHDELYLYGMTRRILDQRGTVSTTLTTAEPLFPRYGSSYYPGGPYAGALGWINNGAGAGFTGGVGGQNAIMNNQVATGMGFSPAEINLAPLTGLPHVYPKTGGSVTTRFRVNWYRFLLEGRADGISATTTVPTTSQPGYAQPLAVPGRYGEMNLINPQQPGIGATGTVFPSPPRAGLTYQANASLTCDDNVPIAPMALQVFLGLQNFRGNVNTDVSLNLRCCPPFSNAFLPPSHPGDAISQLIGHYASPTDVYGQTVVGIGFNGHPVYGHQGYEGEALEDPWELDLSPDARRKIVDDNNNIVDVDAPLTAGELEYILRGADPDVMVTNRRISRLMWDHNLNDSFRNRVTTEQWDLPCPNVTPTPEIAAGLRMLNISPTNLTVGDLVRGKLAAVHALTGGNPTTQRGAIETVVGNLMDPRKRPNMPAGGVNYRAVCISADLIQGLRMDINRPFGNGRDDQMPTSLSPAMPAGRPNPDYVVDDPDELRYMVDRLWANWAAGNPPSGLADDVNRDGFFSANQEMARQTFARHMYFLMMLLTDTQYLRNFPTQETIPAASGNFSPATEQRYKLGAYKLAQWAINTVDFRDRDAINTDFEFDICPFTYAATTNVGGWDVDGALGKDPIRKVASPDDGNASTPPPAYRGLVWGCEYPELLITETAAFHDRRVADTDHERDFQAPRTQRGKTTDTAANRQDPHYDQARLPQGSAFVELYCTGKPNAFPKAQNSDPRYTGSTNASPGDPNLNYLPRELYDTLTPLRDAPGGPVSYGALDLGRMAPQTSATIGRCPVWRLAITQQHRGRDMGRATVREILHDAAGGAAAFKPDSSTLQPERFSLLQTPINVNGPTTAEQVRTIQLRRFVWFGKTVPATGHPDVQSRTVFYNRRPAAAAPDTDALLQPGRYAVVGPARHTGNSAASFRNVTYLGLTDGSVAGWTPQKIDLDAYRTGTNTFVTALKMSAAGTPVQPYPLINTQIKMPLGIPCGKNNGNAYPVVAGFNVTEPRNGFPVDSLHPAPNQATNYGEYSVQDAWSPNTLPDVPYEEQSGVDLFDDNTAQPGTYLDYCTVFLQRLANPLMAWNPAPDDVLYPGLYSATVNDGRVNPYITVDWMPIDVTIFNGQVVYPVGSGAVAQAPQPVTTPGFPTGSYPTAPRNYRRIQTAGPNLNTLCLQSRQRGGRYYSAADFTEFSSAFTGAPYSMNRVGAWPRQTPTLTPPITTSEAPLWPAISDDPQFRRGEPQPSATGLTAGVFRHNMKNTLGFVNTTFGQSVSGTTASPSGPWVTRGSLNSAGYAMVDPLLLDNAIGAPFDSPLKPFPWLTWNNRPYANAMELLLVPSSSQARLTTDFTYKTNTNPTGSTKMQYTDYTAYPQSGDNIHYNPNAPWSWGLWDHGTTAADPGPKMPHARYPLVTTYTPTTVGAPATTSTPGPGSPPQPMAPFGHLLNFFPTSVPGVNVPGGGDFHRIFEYVHVPSKFSGTEEMLSSPSTGFGGGTVNGFDAPIGTSTSPNPGALYPFHAPFNRVSRYREPGKININTMFDAGSTMWNCVTNNFPDFNQQWADILTSKLAVDPRGPDGVRGTNPTTGTNDDVPQSVNEQMLNPDIPSFFPNPFRSFSTPYNVPVASMLGKFVKSPQAGFPAFSPPQPLGFVDSNLLRRVDPVLGAGATPYQPEPLMVFNATLWSGNAGGRPARVASEQRNGYRDPDRNPYFRYQPLIKTGSMLTTRSNVYAIWVTLGFFEVNRVPISPVNPDGFKMVRELGSDAGDVRRHRMFAIFDRSIPVAFQRGENYNVEKAFLMKRIIE